MNSSAIICLCFFLLGTPPTSFGHDPAPAFHVSWNSSRDSHSALLPNGGVIMAEPGSGIEVRRKGAESVTVWRFTAPLSGGRYPVTVDSDASLTILVPHLVQPDRRGFIDGYPMGIFPDPGRAGSKLRGSVSKPERFYRVTSPDSEAMISRRLSLGEFISKIRPEHAYDGDTHWITLDYTLVETIERIADRMNELYPGQSPGDGIRLESPYRTPDYNNAGSTGRAGFSMHMYGKAADIVFSTDGDTFTDDVNRDGAINWDDILPIACEIDRMMADGRIPQGGLGIYRFVYDSPRPDEYQIHVDVRGYRARWGYFHDRNATTPAYEVEWLDRDEIRLIPRR